MSILLAVTRSKMGFIEKNAKNNIEIAQNDLSSTIGNPRGSVWKTPVTKDPNQVEKLKRTNIKKKK